MDFANEPYVRVYRRDSQTWRRLGFEGQVCLMFLLRRTNLAGAIELEGFEPWQAAVSFCGVPEAVARAGVERLLAEGCVTVADGRLTFPRYAEAQESPASQAERQRESRAKAALRDGKPTAPRADTISADESQIVTWDPVMGARRKVTGPVPQLAAKGAAWLSTATGLEPYAHSGRWASALVELAQKPAAELAIVAKVLAEQAARGADFALMLTPQHVLDYWPKYKRERTPGAQLNGNGHRVAPGTTEVEAARSESERCKQAYQRARSDAERNQAQEKWLQADRKLREAKERYGWIQQT